MNSVTRPSGRASDQLRTVTIERHYTRHAEGSVLVSFGDTRVLCTASIEDRAPAWLRGKGEGWITAEYGMLPRATNTRMQREAARGGQGGRTMEIQRLIGRSLRASPVRRTVRSSLPRDNFAATRSRNCDSNARKSSGSRGLNSR